MLIASLTWELPPAHSGGLGVAVEALSRSMAGSGHRVLTVVPAGRGELVGPGLETMAVGERRLMGYQSVGVGLWASEVRAYRDDVVAALAGTGVEAIHAHDWMTWEAGASAAEVLGVPMIAHVHSLETDRAGPWGCEAIGEAERRGLERADLVVAVSERCASACRRLSPGARVEVVYTPVERPAVETGWVGPGWVDDGRRVVLFAGRLAWQKDPSTFVECAAVLSRRRGDLRFVLVGDGPERPALREMIDSMGLTGVVELAGWRPRAWVHGAMSRSACVVMPSRAEPFGLVAAEAWSLGVPTVVSDVAGALEVYPGLVACPVGDACAFASGVELAIRRGGEGWNGARMKQPRRDVRLARLVESIACRVGA